MKLLSFLAEFSVVLISLTIAVATLVLNVLLWLLPRALSVVANVVRALFRATSGHPASAHKTRAMSDRRKPANARRHWR